jgi:hypothetical protein
MHVGVSDGCLVVAQHGLPVKFLHSFVVGGTAGSSVGAAAVVAVIVSVVVGAVVVTAAEAPAGIISAAIAITIANTGSMSRFNVRVSCVVVVLALQ